MTLFGDRGRPGSDRGALGSRESVLAEGDAPILASTLRALRPSWMRRALHGATGAVLSIYGVAIGIEMLTRTSGGGPSNWIAVGMAAAMGVAGVHLLRRGWTGRPAVDWTDDVLILRTGILTPERRIPWRDVLNVRRQKDGTAILELTDAGARQERAGFGARLRWLGRKLIGREGMVVRGTFIGVAPEVLGEALETKLLQWERRQIIDGREDTGPNAPQPSLP